MPAKVTPIRTARQRKQERPDAALQFLIVLTGTDPLVWRRILVPDAYSFWDLHVAIQDAMGWKDYHLHEFTVTNPASGLIERLGIPDPDEPADRPRAPGWTVRLSRYFNWQTLGDLPTPSYVYDFGDEWRHSVVFEDMLAAGDRRLPRCVAGARACPPEDCGGAHGFAELLSALAHPGRRRHAELLEWVGPYDPEAFNPARVRFDDPAKRWKRAFEE